MNIQSLTCVRSVLAFALGVIFFLPARGLAAETVSGNLLLQAKGEVEVYHNGRKIFLGDKSDHNQHFRVKVPERDFNTGDVIVLHIRSPYVYRAILAAINLGKKAGQIPVKKQHWRFLGSGADPRKLTADIILASKDVPASAEPDGVGAAEREKLGFISSTENGSEWIKTQDQLKGWYCVGFILTQEMLDTRLPVK